MKPTPQNFLDLVHERHSINDGLASRFPPEIMSLIFILFDNINKPEGQERIDMSQREYENWDHLLRTPNLLSKVCRRWRDIALSTPQLWTKYYFNVWTQARDFELLKEFLSRSGSLPLSIIMWGDHANDDDEDLKSISLEPIATLIRSYSARWKFLDIYYVPEGLTEELFKDLDYIHPSVLEGLRIDHSSISQPIHLREPLRPRHLSIQYMQHRGARPMISLEWDNITHLEVSDIGINTLLNIVKQIPRLTKWLSSAIASEFEATDPLPETPIVIPALKQLELTFKENNPDFFPYLTLPSLTFLKLCFGEEEEEEEEEADLEFDDLISFIARSKLDSESLQTFELRYSVVDVDYDHRFIDLTALTCLSVDFRADEQNVISDYLSRISPTSILPHLRQLHIQATEMPSSSWAALCDVISPTRLADYVNPETSRFTSLQLPLLSPERPLERITVMLLRRYGRGGDGPTIIPYEDFRFLRDVDQARVVQIFMRECTKRYETVDIMQSMAMRYELTEIMERYSLS